MESEKYCLEWNKLEQITSEDTMKRNIADDEAIDDNDDIVCDSRGFIKNTLTWLQRQNKIEQLILEKRINRQQLTKNIHLTSHDEPKMQNKAVVCDSHVFIKTVFTWLQRQNKIEQQILEKRSKRTQTMKMKHQ